MANEISERAQYLLKVLVENYIRAGQPVGSRMLARDSRLDLSPATVRNVMADLEELGLVSSPHTSAGRIPTTKGYRVFVDSLLTIQPVDNHEIMRMKEKLGKDDTITDMAESVSGLLSAVTSMAGVVMLPRKDHRAIRYIEFMPLSDRRVLAILVINDKEVQNHIIKTDREYTSQELQQAANCFNSVFAGMNLLEARQHLLAQMKETREDMDRIMQTAITMAEQVFASKAEGDYVMSGQTNLMDCEQLSNIETLRVLFEAFNEKHQILHLLDQCMGTQGVQIFIGEESGYKILDECSLVTSTYEVDGQVLGVLGVIGPTRMAYERVIPLVDVTAKLVSAVLNQPRKSQ
ncbi:MAG TPA: heat-inducible transcriptional repressor HrcA [Gammaproteobacteria bacterium]